MLLINKNDIASIPYFDKATREKVDDFIHFLDNSEFRKGRIQYSGDPELFCYAQEYETHEFNPESWEKHGRYFDLQYMQMGEELALYAPQNIKRVIKDYDEGSDCELIHAENGTECVLKEGYILIFEPGEFHNTGIMNESVKTVRKFVIKCSR